MLKSVFTLAVFFVAAVSAMAQKTMVYENPDPLFKKGLELYDKQHYNNAIREFEMFLQSAPSEIAVSETKFYIASSKLKLEHENGLTEMLSFLEEYPESAKSNMANKQIADYYYYNKKYKTALSYYKKVNLSAFSSDETEEILFNKGFCLFKSEKYEESREAFYPLTLKDGPNKIKATYYYGYVSYMNKNYKDALKAFLSIEEKGPQTMKLYICQIYYLNGDYEKAIDYANKINLGKLNGKRDLVKAKSYFRLKDYTKAQTNFESAEYSIDSITDEEIYEIGYTYYVNKECAKSFALFEKIANDGTALAQSASYHLGDCFLKANQKQNAFNAFFEAQRTNFDPFIKEEATYNYARLAYELNYTSIAIATFQKFIETYPKSSHLNESRKNLASLFLVSNDYKTAVSVLENIENMDEETKGIYQKITYSRGEELVINKDWAAATKMFETAAKNRVDELIYAMSYYWQAEINYRNGKPDLARMQYQKFIDNARSKESKYYPQALYGIGYTYYSQKNYLLAADYFKQFKALNGKFVIDPSLFYDATMRLGDSYYTIKNYSAALDAYYYITSNNAAGSDYALFQQGMIYGLTDKTTNKINTMKKIARDFPSSTYIVDGIFESAEEYFRSDNYIEAERNYKYLIEDYPNSIYVRRSYMTLGLLYRNQNKDDQSIETYKLVVSKYRGTEEAREALRFIKEIYVENSRADEYFAWVETIPNSGISYTSKDSISYNSAYNTYVKGDCSASISSFEKYNTDYPAGFFRIPANYYTAICY
ncbi:MAG: tetratricopeptide repeat protein, partial [Bacteroidia bacterium]|nr:tetratricopeptide repeat protein [Bacteroidia bacterium]